MIGAVAVSTPPGMTSEAIDRNPDGACGREARSRRSGEADEKRAPENALARLLFHPANLNALQLRVWFMIFRAPNLSIGDLAAALGVHRDSVRRSVTALDELGLLTRGQQDRDPDSGTYDRYPSRAVPPK